jgi:hypothetical protein
MLLLLLPMSSRPARPMRRRRVCRLPLLLLLLLPLLLLLLLLPRLVVYILRCGRGRPPVLSLKKPLLTRLDAGLTMSSLA